MRVPKGGTILVVLSAIGGLYLLSTPSTAAASAPQSGSPILVRGRLQAPGFASLYLAPTGARGTGYLQTVVARPTFQMRMAPTRQLALEASKNGGYVNFNLLLYAAGRMRVYAFSRLLKGGGWSLGAAAPLPALISTAGGAARAHFSPHVPCYYNVVGTNNDVLTSVGEIHTYTSDVKDQFTYGQDADSNISVGFDYGNGWLMSGTDYLANSGAWVSLTRSGPFGHRMSSNFQYKKYDYYNCGYYEIRSTQWQGGMQVGQDNSNNDGLCGTQYLKYRQEFASGAQFGRDQYRYTTFSVAADVFGVAGFTAQSGAGIYTTFHWWFNQPIGQERSLCGNDNQPTYASQIFAGG